MSRTLKVIEKLDENKFIVEVVEYPFHTKNKKTFGIAHDFVEFGGTTTFTKSPGVNSSSDNTKLKDIFTSVQIPIRMFKTVIMPLLQESEYLKEDHFKERESEEGNYPAYAYHDKVVLSYYDKKLKLQMVAILLRNEIEPTIMTQSFFNKICKDHEFFK